MSKSFKNNEKSTIFDGKSYMVENKQEDYLIAENQFDYGDQNVNEYLGEQNGEED